MIQRFIARPHREGRGWCIYDLKTGKVAVFNGHQTLGLSMEDADDLAHLLNASHPVKGGASAT